MHQKVSALHREAGQSDVAHLIDILVDHIGVKVIEPLLLVSLHQCCRKVVAGGCEVSHELVLRGSCECQSACVAAITMDQSQRRILESMRNVLGQEAHAHRLTALLQGGPSGEAWRKASLQSKDVIQPLEIAFVISATRDAATYTALRKAFPGASVSHNPAKSVRLQLNVKPSSLSSTGLFDGFLGHSAHANAVSAPQDCLTICQTMTDLSPPLNCCELQSY